MIEAFFMVFLAICSVFIAIFSYHYDKDNLWLVFALLLVAMAGIVWWPLSGIFIVALAASAYKKLSYASFVTLSMMSAVMIAHFLLYIFMLYDVPFLLPIAIVTVTAICALAIFGLFEDNLRKFLIISNVIQIIFIVLDLSIGKIEGTLSIMGTVQIFNYGFAGLALFLTIGVLSFGKEAISELEGSYFEYRWNDIFCTIACLSLAGLPLFNMFVSEWALFTAAYTHAPMVSILGIFAALLLFIMYYKVVYVLLVGEGVEKHEPIPTTLLNGILAALCILLGLLPEVQWAILGGII